MMNQPIPGSLLFYLPGDSFTAQFARGQAEPNFNMRTELIADGPFGGAIRCDNKQRLSWKAPGNIYGERGTISFFWRSRYPVGPTPFPVFRVGFADHSSWDCAFIRIDWNGEGFEAFVTDANLSRARIHNKLETALDPEKWYHIALSWDENWGIKLYLDGEKIAEEYRPAVYFTGLDQFGPHSRIISHWQVQSDYNFIRGGDVAEIAIFDQMLPCGDIAQLAKGQLPQTEAFAPCFTCQDVQKGWLLRNGFDQELRALPDSAVVRKVEIHDAYDLKRWWWKGCDGIRETTWPGVFNRSRLKGRNDYFQLPDWDCYSLSGKSITFTAPDEPYNHVEISGSAYGAVELLDDAGQDARKLFDRAPGRERSSDEITRRRGGKLRFTNIAQEEPIADFSLYNVYEGEAPEAVKSVCYQVRPGVNESCPAQKELAAFIRGRYTRYERTIMTAVAQDQPAALSEETQTASYPFVHVIIPYEADDTLGLDGIELSFDAPAQAKLSIQVKDPLWYYRNLAQFTFSVQPGRKTIFFDTRDRILPQGKCLYLTIAADAALPENLCVRTVFKSAQDAKAEHVLDRFTQLRDAYGHMTEERPLQKEYNLFNRYFGDMMDLLKVDPDHKPGLYYLHDCYIHMESRLKVKPAYVAKFETEPVPQGVPAWAFKQVEFLRKYKKVVNWYIDNRMIENGELGGGLSDDGDYVATWFTLVQMDSDADKVKEAIFRNTEAFYQQGMFTNGLCSIQADELHSSEEGLVSLSGCMNAEFGNPLWLERAMETARQLGWLTGINKAGHRHIKSTYYNGSQMATEEPWGGQQASSYIAIGPCWQVARYNGNPELLTYLRELADGLMAHCDPETGKVCSYVRFEDDKEMEAVNGRVGGERALLVPAWKLLNDDRYYSVLPESKGQKKRNRFGGEDGNDGKVAFRPFKQTDPNALDKDAIAERYESMNQLAGIREYYNTMGHPWIDRVFFTADTLCCERLGDPTNRVARYNYPSHTIGWKFANAGDDEKVAILSPITQKDHVKLIVCNITGQPVHANIIGNEVAPGTWSVSCGVDTNDDDKADKDIVSFESEFEWSKSIAVTFAPHTTTVVELKLVKDGVPYWQRCDLGVSKEDVRYYRHGMNVRIHSLGAMPSPEVTVALKNAQGVTLKTQTLPPLPAPTDLWPRYRDVIFNLHNIDSLEGCYVEIDPEHKLCETTRNNNIVKL